MTAWPKWIASSALAVALLVGGACWGLYWYGNAVLPKTLTPSARQYPDDVRMLYWTSEGSRDRIDIPEMNPLTMMWRIADAPNLPARQLPDGSNESADLKVALPAVRSAMLDAVPRQSGLRRHAAGFALQVRISREWTAAQIIDTSLDRSMFGRKALGLDAAAQTYFGETIERLSEPEQLALLVIARAPSGYDPACGRQRFAERYARLAATAGLDASTVDAVQRRMIPARCER